MLVDQTYLSTQVYLMVAALYLAMSLPLAYALRKLALDTTDAPRGAVSQRHITGSKIHVDRGAIAI